MNDFVKVILGATIVLLTIVFLSGFGEVGDYVAVASMAAATFGLFLVVAGKPKAEKTVDVIEDGEYTLEHVFDENKNGEGGNISKDNASRVVCVWPLEKENIRDRWIAWRICKENDPLDLFEHLGTLKGLVLKVKENKIVEMVVYTA